MCIDILQYKNPFVLLLFIGIGECRQDILLDGLVWSLEALWLCVTACVLTTSSQLQYLRLYFLSDERDHGTT